MFRVCNWRVVGEPHATEVRPWAGRETSCICFSSNFPVRPCIFKRRSGGVRAVLMHMSWAVAARPFVDGWAAGTTTTGPLPTTNNYYVLVSIPVAIGSAYTPDGGRWDEATITFPFFLQ